MSRRFAGVSITVGATALMLMSKVFTSSATEATSALIAALVAT